MAGVPLDALIRATAPLWIGILLGTLLSGWAPPKAPMEASAREYDSICNGICLLCDEPVEPPSSAFNETASNGSNPERASAPKSSQLSKGQSALQREEAKPGDNAGQLIAVVGHMAQRQHHPCQGRCATYEVRSASIVSPLGHRLDRQSIASRQGAQQHQQNADVALILGDLRDNNCFGADAFVYLESDFAWCPGAHEELRALSAHLHDPGVWSEWSFVRASYGMNGWVMKCEDLPRVVAHLHENIRRRGLDWWLPKVYADGERFVYRWNLFTHHFEMTAMDMQGNEPAIRQHHLAKCYDFVMASGMISDLPNSNFNSTACGAYDMTPCNSAVARPLAALAATYSREKKDNILKRQSTRQQLKQRFPSANIILGPEQADCHKACRQLGRRCDDGAMPLANDCEAMLALQPDCTCTAWEFFQFSSRETRPPKVMPLLSTWRKQCVISFDDALVSCNGRSEPKRPKTRPFCACVDD